MENPNLSVREIQKDDIPLLVNYWMSASPEYLSAMGADHAKLPSKEGFEQMLAKQLITPMKQKAAYALIWLINGVPSGHSNVNKIEFGKSAFMHLHLWQSTTRQKGMGAQLVKLGLPYFFNNLKLQTLYSEPYALNPAPNKTLPKVGFEFVKEYITIPGSLNFEQPVVRWKMTREQFLQLNLANE